MEREQKRKILITGGTSGLGFESVKLFLNEGYIVCATGRNMTGNPIKNDDFFFVKCDFSDLSETVSAVNKITELIGIPDIIINNAGILSPPVFTLSHDGFELTIQVNLLAHLLINELIIRRMDSGHCLLITSVTSPVYRFVKPVNKLPDAENYHAFKTYSETKYYLLIMGEYLLKKFPENNICSIAFNPGTFSSGIYRMQKKYFHALYRIAAPFMRSPVRVARNLVKVIINGDLLSGGIYRLAGKRKQLRKINHDDSLRFMEECTNLMVKFR